MPVDDQENVTIDNAKLYPIYSKFILQLLLLSPPEQAFCIASAIACMSTGGRDNFIELVQEILPQLGEPT